MNFDINKGNNNNTNKNDEIKIIKITDDKLFFKTLHGGKVGLFCGIVVSEEALVFHKVIEQVISQIFI